MFAQQAGSAAQGLTPLNRFPRMMQEYVGAKVAETEQKSITRLASLKTKEEAEAHVKLVRSLIADCFGTFPEKTPLKPKDGSVKLNLQAVFAHCYDECGYGKAISYGRDPVTPPLTEEQSAWATSLCAASLT